MPMPYENDDWTRFDDIVLGHTGHFEARRAIDPEYVIGLPGDSEEGRSNWFWLRTPSNDLMLCCFPTGCAYIGSALDWGRP